MNRKEVIEAVHTALKGKVNNEEATRAVKVALQTIISGLKRDGVVILPEFGTFRVREISARSGFDINTRKRTVHPAHKRVAFTAGKHANGVVNNNHDEV